MVHGDGKEALDGALVQVHGEDAVGAGTDDGVGDEPRRDGLAPPELLLLLAVGEVGNDSGDLGRRGPPRRVDHDEELPEPIVHTLFEGLNDEDVGAPNVLAELDADLAVGPGVQQRVRDLASRVVRDLLGQLGGLAATEEPESIR
jgi:hypothetical protein